LKGKSFRTIYISHPLRGGADRENPDISTIVKNKEDIDRICRSIAENVPGVLPLSPVNTFSFFEVLKEDDLALEMDLKLLELADAMWVYGEWQSSEGCNMEIARARELGMPILFEDHNEFPERYYCPETINWEAVSGLCSQIVPAYDIERASVVIGCTPQCKEEHGCCGLAKMEKEGI
jgi:hypothetical protein